MLLSMKKYTGYFIIGAAIIIASIIFSAVIYNKHTSSLDDCYKKVYKSELLRISKYRKQSTYTSSNTAEAVASTEARYMCLKGETY
jgi:hypothetical protein